MSRSFRDLLKFSAPALLSAALLSGCGSGSNGAADLSQGPSVSTPPPPVTVTETFDFVSTTSSFVVGTPPIHARFSGGRATDAGTGAWIIPSGQTGVVDFGTPADAVKFSTQDNFVAAASPDGGAEKGAFLPSSTRKVDAPFDTAMYVRGSVRGDWAVLPENQLQEVSDNVLAVTIPLEPGDYQFKVADAGWTGATNCGGSDNPTPVPLGSAFTLGCSNGSQNLAITIPAPGGDYKFTFDATGADKTAPKITVAKDTGGGGGGGGGEVPEDSTIIRIYAKDVLTAGSQSTLLKTVKGLGSLSVDEVRQGGATRITRIEIENTGVAGDIGVDNFAWTANPQFAPANVSVSINYTRPTGGYAGTTITVGGQSYPCTLAANGLSCTASGVSVPPFANASMTVSNADGSRETITFNAGNGDPVYAFSGSTAARSGTPGESGKAAAVPRNANEVILFYKRDDGAYTGWGLHLFPLDPPGDAWTKFPTPGEFPFEGIDPQWGAYFRIALPGKETPRYSNNPPAMDTFPNRLGFIIHKGDVKDPGSDQVIERASSGNTVFVISGVNDVSSVPPGGGTVLRITGAAAHWVDQTSLLWTPPTDVTSVELLYSPNATINAGAQGITGTYETIPLTSGTNPQPAFNKELHGLKAWTLPATATAAAKDLARGQLIAIGRNSKNEAIAGTLVQTAGALDAIYAAAAYGKTLGVSYASGVPSLAVWAPTALKTPGLTVNVYEANGTKIESRPMTLEEASGVWSVTGEASWNRKFYTISLQVYSYATNSIVTNEVTDPYSVSLSTDSARSQFVNLNDVDLKPAGWDDPNWNDPNVLRPIAAPEDIVLYELHVRDFSIQPDASLPAGDRGKFTAFANQNFIGMQHLRDLADAGLTHVHILPAFDFATVRENPDDQVNLDDNVSKLCAANSAAASLCVTDAGKTIRQAMTDAVAAKQLDRPQQITEWMRDLDGFNWGYDPLHFGAPEGSYASYTNGVSETGEGRVKEFRAMVQGLRDAGLRTVLDVVYNHTNASGQNNRAVLDRLVPGYYHRRNITSGNVEKNSCCDDTAAEFRMMEKLMIDTGVMWVRDYKITGFRFDIMSFHPLDSMKKFQEAVKAVDPAVYIYGEGWNFGSVQDDKRFVTARQANLGGTGIGSFSDRIRDPVRGGVYDDSGANLVQNQGFVSGWFYAPNSANTGSTAERDALISWSDNIRAWLAGGLADYRFQNAAGNVVKGSQIDYRGQPSAYTQDPQEAINYASKHDGATIWDISQYKHATGTPLEERVRADNVATSVIMLAQGVPFIHAGTELLRSKSMDQNSYDSGDWFNAIDWTLATSRWNQGLPRAADNSGNYDQIRNVALDVTAVQDPVSRNAAFANFKEMLELRSSSKLFRLRTKTQIDQRVRLYNTGPFQIPGVIAMGIDGCAETNFAPEDAALMVIFNATDDPRTLQLFRNEAWSLHPVLQDAVNEDPVVKTASYDANNGFTVPARTTAVFRRTAPAQTTCSPYPVDMFVRGSFNNWANPPPANYKLQFLGGSSLAVSAPVGTTGNHEFKIADAGWSPATNCGVGPNGLSDVRLGVPITLTCADGTGNLRMNAPSTGNYTFALNAASTANPVLTVSKTPPTPLTLFVRGGFNNWGNPPDPPAPLVWDAAGTYRATVNGIAASTFEFKIADNDWGGTTGGATNCGGPGGTISDVALGQPFALNCADGSGNLRAAFAPAGSYLFAVNWSNPAAPSLTVEKVPVDVPVFVRGIGGDWTDAAANQMSYFGGGIWSLNKAVAAAANEFKVASTDWATVDCGAGAAGDTVTVGTPLAIGCNSGNGNLKLTPARAGTYTFKYRRDTPTAGEVTVSGP
jgi:pullulanase